LSDQLFKPLHNNIKFVSNFDDEWQDRMCKKLRKKSGGADVVRTKALYNSGALKI